MGARQIGHWSGEPAEREGEIVGRLGDGSGVALRCAESRDSPRSSGSHPGSRHATRRGLRPPRVHRRAPWGIRRHRPRRGPDERARFPPAGIRASARTARASRRGVARPRSALPRPTSRRQRAGCRGPPPASRANGACSPAEQLGCGLVCERGEVLRVRASQLIATATLGEPLQRVLADGLEHREARLAVARCDLAHEALVDAASRDRRDGVRRARSPGQTASMASSRAPPANTASRRKSARSSSSSRS